MTDAGRDARWHVAARAACVLAIVLAVSIVPWACREVAEDPERAEPTGHAQRAGRVEPVAVEPFDLGSADLVILATGGSDGLLEVCNCIGPMPGGLARRSGLVTSYRSAFDRVLVIDTGNFFHYQRGDIRNDFILRGYRQVGYDTVCLGLHEWGQGLAGLASAQQADPIPLLSTTVRATEDVALKSIDELRISTPAGPVVLMSITDPELLGFLDKSIRAKLELGSIESFAAAVSGRKDEGAVVVAIVHGSESFADSLAAGSDVDAIIRGEGKIPQAQIRTQSGVSIVKVGGNETVGVLAIKLAGPGRLAQVEWRLEAVDERWPLDEGLMQTYQAYAYAAMQEALGADRKAGLVYEASSTCGQCHRAQYDNWTETRHRHAYATLQQAGRTDDPNCLACHTTGFATKSGFYTLDSTPQMANVNCQDCHRFNLSEHKVDGFVAPKVTDQICTSCHTPVTSPKFQFDVRRGEIRCPGGSPAHQHEWLDRRDR